MSLESKNPAGDPIEEHNTAELVVNAHGGSARDLEQLYVRLFPALHAWARVRIRHGIQERMDADDLIAEVWLRALRAFSKFDPARSSFRAWIFKIAQHVLLTEFRAAGTRARPRNRDGTSNLLSDVPANVTTMSQRVGRSEMVQQLVDYIDSLDETDRQLLVQHGLEEKTLAVVARQLGISLDAATKRWQRARDRMRERGIGAEFL